MKPTHRKIAFVIVSLIVFTTVVSCEEESDTLTQSELASKTTTTSPSPSTGLRKARLDHYAYEAYAGLYGVELNPENSQVIDKATLLAWVEANEKNKHTTINQKNRAALEAMEDSQALLIQAPAGAPFRSSVFVLSKHRSIVITDVIDNLFDTRFITVKEGVGFYGNGYLDAEGNHPCACIEEHKIILKGASYTECGRCPDPDELPDFPF